MTIPKIYNTSTVNVSGNKLTRDDINKIIAYIRMKILNNSYDNFKAFGQDVDFLINIASLKEPAYIGECEGIVENAARTLAYFSSPKATRFLIKNLSSPDVRRRRWASCSLSSVAPETKETKNAAIPMQKLLDPGDKNPTVRMDAASFFGRYPNLVSPGIYMSIIAATKKEKDPIVLKALLTTLGQIAGTNLSRSNEIVGILDSFSSSTDPYIKQGLADAYGRFPSKVGALYLNSLLENNDNAVDLVLVVVWIRKQQQYSVLAKDTVINALHKSNNNLFWINELQKTLDYILQY